MTSIEQKEEYNPKFGDDSGEDLNGGPISSSLSKTKINQGFYENQIELASLSSKNHLEELDEFNTFQTYGNEMTAKRESNKKYMEIAMRGLGAIILLIGLWYFRRGSTVDVYPDGFCLKDQGHIWTESVNDLCHQNKNWLTFFQLTSSGMMDTVMLTMMIYWWFHGTGGHIIWCVAFFYGLRGVVQGNFKMRYTEKGIWDYPGIPSLVVPYGLQSDYYFSGHCGFIALNIADQWSYGNKKTAILFMFFLPYVAYVLIMTEIHYTIDIPIGIMFGFYLYIMLKPHTKKWDRHLAKTCMALKNWLCGK